MRNPLDDVEPLNMVKSTKAEHSFLKWYIFAAFVILLIL